VRLNTELENVDEWLTANKLTLNIEKTEYMIIGSYKRISNIQKVDEIKIRIGDNEIKRVKTTKSLGIVIDENLARNENIDNLIVKVSRAIGVIRRPKKCVKQDALKLMYNLKFSGFKIQRQELQQEIHTTLDQKMFSVN
jgi:hypothetical protein